MKIAIMGAGLAGLSCAHELERHGIYPTIFEKRHRVGERFPNNEAILQFINRPHLDPFHYLNKELNLPIKPTGYINSIVFKTENKRARVSGKLGYSTTRGHLENSLECQLERAIKSRIYFNKDIDHRLISAEYDYVVIATGDTTIPVELGLWERYVSAYIKGANTDGNFKPDEVIMWLNTDYAKTGYAYLLPYNKNRACLSLSVPESNPKELDLLWEAFLEKENITLVNEQVFKLEKFEIGKIKEYQYNNLLFVGTAAGSMESLFGFGQFWACITGVMAARAIAKDLNYTHMVRMLTEINENFFEIRKHINDYSNKDFERVVNLINIPVIKTLLTKVNIDYIKWAARFIRALS